jgi:hypothetical protein
MADAPPAAYNHAMWLNQMAALLAVEDAIRNELEAQLASLHDVKAGDTHLAHVATCAALAGDCVDQGKMTVAEVNRIYLPVAEAIAGAGGVTEVAQRKTFHQPA